jgi:hypothetical protein
MKNSKVVIGAVIGLVLASSGIAIAQVGSEDSSTQVIYGCVTGLNGNIVKVSNVAHACPKNTTAINWNVVGPKGDQGIPGPKGEAASAPSPEIPIINSPSIQSWVMQSGFDRDRDFICLGGTPLVHGGYPKFCYKTIYGQNLLTFLDIEVQSSPSSEPFYVLDSACPQSIDQIWSETQSRGAAGWLVSGAKPFSYQLSTPESCFVIMQPYNNDSGMFHIEAKLN